MKNFFLLSVMAVLLMAARCGTGPDLPASVYGKTWLNSYEEDSVGVKTYRPNTYDFPPSRGRTGFMLQEDGTFIRYGIAPTDGLEEHPGKWEAKGKNRLRITFQNPKHDSEELEIVSVSAEMIKIHRLGNQE